MNEHSLSAAECERIQAIVLDMAREQVDRLPALAAAFNMFEFGMILAISNPHLAQTTLEAILPLGVHPMEHETTTRYFGRCCRIRADRERQLAWLLSGNRPT